MLRKRFEGASTATLMMDSRKSSERSICEKGVNGGESKLRGRKNGKKFFF